MIAWPLRTLLWKIVGTVTGTGQRAQFGRAARALFKFALSEARGARLVTVAIDLVSDTYETDMQASRALLEQLLTGQRFTEHAHEDIPALARAAKRISEHDPDFVREIYRTTFTQRVSDTSATSMGDSQILPLTSNKKQDYDHARWHLSQYVPGFLDTKPEFGVRLLVTALEGRVASEHPTNAEVVSTVIGGKAVHSPTYCVSCATTPPPTSRAPQAGRVSSGRRPLPSVPQLGDCRCAMFGNRARAPHHRNQWCRRLLNCHRIGLVPSTVSTTST